MGTAKEAGNVTVLWGGKSGLSAASTLPVPRVAHGRYGLDVAAVRDKGGARVLVGGYDGSVEFSGTFTRTGAVGAKTVNQSTPSVAVVDLADLNRDGRADRIVTSVRIGGHTGGLLYVNPGSSATPLPADGTTTAVGDVNGDGYNDLVVGDPDEPAGASDGHKGGQITLWFGGKNGLAVTPVRISQDTPGVTGTAAKHNAFGTAVAVTDLNKDGLGDIVVGVPGQTQNNKARAGVVVVVPGKKTGTPGAGSYQLSQETVSVPGTSAEGDAFGATLAVGASTRTATPT